MLDESILKIISLVVIYGLSVSMVAALTTDLTTSSETRVMSTENQLERELTVKIQKPDNSFRASYYEESLPPFGPGILDGYETCNDFKDDIESIFIAIGKSFIEENKSINCTTIYYYDNDLPYGNSHNRREEEATSYQMNNQVPNVEEQDRIKSNGKFIFIGAEDSIFIYDLNGKLVESTKMPFPTAGSDEAASLVLDSIFVHENILTALTTTSVCKKPEGNPCNYSINALLYRFLPKKKTLKLMKQFQVSSGDYGDRGFYQARSIGFFTYVVLRESYNPVSEGLDRCRFQNISLSDYEREALNYLNTLAVTSAQEIVTAILNNGALPTCSNVIRLSHEMSLLNYENIDWPSLGIDKVTSFGLKSASMINFKTSSYFFPFFYTSQGGIKPVVFATEDCLLIAEPSTSELTFLVQFSRRDSVFNPSAVGTVGGFIDSQYSIDYYNGHYRIASTTSPTTRMNMSLEMVSPRMTIMKEINSQLVISGEVMDFDPGSDLKWVRFTADMGFVVSTYNESATLRVINMTSTTNPEIIITQIDGNFSSHFIEKFPFIHKPIAEPIEDGKFILLVSNVVSKENAMGLSTCLFQVSSDGVYEMERIGEAVLETRESSYYAYSVASWDTHAVRYISQARKLVIPSDVDIQNCTGTGNMIECTTTTSSDSFSGFLVFDIGLTNGVTYIGNVTHFNDCVYFSPRSMVVKGDLITIKGGSMKRTSNISTLKDLDWETNFC